jgi:hypothetical protein
VATSGLALSIGNYDLALGAFLLFAVNMVAIVLAAFVSLWAVGIRKVGKAKGAPRFIGTTLMIIAIVTALLLTFYPPRLAPPVEVIQEVEGLLVNDYRLREIRLQRQFGLLKVQMDIGGSRLPDSLLKQQLGTIARKHLGKDVAVRLTFRYETLVK